MPSMLSSLTNWLYALFHLLVNAFTFWHHVPTAPVAGKRNGDQTAWPQTLRSFFTSNTLKSRLEARMATATTYEEWHAAGLELDTLLGNDLWRKDPTSRHFDSQLISTRLNALLAARKSSPPPTELISTLRSGLLRNMGNITNTPLFSRSHIGTKLLISTYIDTVVKTLDYLASIPPSPAFTHQQKLSFISDTRQSFGRTAVMLQGGATFGLCHLGVVRALHRKGLLPRIITGSGVGALIAALVGIHTDPELPHFLSGAGIDLTAFPSHPGSWKRKVSRFLHTGYLLDIKVLEVCVRANVGDLTFLEAYTRTKRILSISVSTSDPHHPVPTLLNYLTAPHVLIRSAACASNAPSPLFQEVQLLCKTETGEIEPWVAEDVVWTRSADRALERDSPYTRLAEQFNVNHFIVSMARPYFAPFLSSDMHRHRRRGIYLKIVRLTGMEIKHFMQQLDTLGLLPRTFRSFLVGEMVPGASITVVPKLRVSDFEQLLSNPRPETVDYWVTKGERAMWGAVDLIRTAVKIELKLDSLYWSIKDTVQKEATDDGNSKRRRKVAGSRAMHRRPSE